MKSSNTHKIQNPRKLKNYSSKRDFAETPEPADKGEVKSLPKGPIFVVQMHDATRLHYDFRLEVDGVLKSWAVPKGPSLNPTDKRLAMMTEDHPLTYAAFEGVIPEGQYGAGPVMVWDLGLYRNLKENKMAEAIEEGQVEVQLEGKKLHGNYALVRTGDAGEKRWLLIKMKDAKADSESNILDKDKSVLTGRSIDKINKEGNEEK